VLIPAPAKEKDKMLQVYINISTALFLVSFIGYEKQRKRDENLFTHENIQNLNQHLLYRSVLLPLIIYKLRDQTKQHSSVYHTK